ncbi:ParB/RepB/Spo0J family partition protein [Patescibacteria group bacterium]|nr:ParB/RepB/Spo0J family partition protein [Patescibacteria group bacterium]
MNQSGLGRGLSSLIPNLSKVNQDSSDSFLSSPEERIIRISLSRIEKNPFQPRENFDYEEMEELVESVKKHGILQPLIVTKAGDDYQLIAGERRLKAAKILELETVPAIVRDVDNIEKLELALIENLQRQNLNPMEEANAYKKLIDEFNLTQEAISLRVGKKRTTITNSLRLLDLPKEIQQSLSDRKITTGHAKVILSADTEKERLNLFKKIINLTLTVRGAEAEVKKVRVKAHERNLNKDVEILDREDRLRKALNTKVTINKKEAGGNIVIDFYSVEELENLIEKLTKKTD